MQVYQTDKQGVYVGVTAADQDPLDAGNWLIPAGCVTKPPPAVNEKQLAQWSNGVWTVVDVPDPVDPGPDYTVIMTSEMKRVARLEAYRDESDPLFFKAQRGEATMDEWLALVAEIKTRYPYPT